MDRRHMREFYMIASLIAKLGKHTKQIMIDMKFIGRTMQYIGDLITHPYIEFTHFSFKFVKE